MSCTRLHESPIKTLEVSPSKTLQTTSYKLHCGDKGWRNNVVKASAFDAVKFLWARRARVNALCEQQHNRLSTCHHSYLLGSRHLLSSSTRRLLCFFGHKLPFLCGGSRRPFSFPCVKRSLSAQCAYLAKLARLIETH